MRTKNKYRIITLLATIILCIVVICLNVLSHIETQRIYLDHTEKIMMDLKKDFIKDTVANLSLEIDGLREAKYNQYKKSTKARLQQLREQSYLPKDDFAEFYINIFSDDTYNNIWTTILWDESTGEVLYSSSPILNDDINKVVEELKGTLSFYEEIKKGNQKGIFGVKKSYIEKMVKEEMGASIRSRKFSKDSYIWVNEVINYEGGENYGIRRIDSDLKNTEEIFLSTEMEDAKGNLPYLEELEGIKKDGEVFYTYYFKRLNSPEISEKITYAKLYKDYDWILVMGTDLEDIDTTAEKVNDEIVKLSTWSVIRLLGSILIVFLIGFTTLSFIEKKNLNHSTKSLQREINIDMVTKAFSRRYGEKKIIEYFKQYKLTGDSPAIMMVDLDNFKQINDKYGHNVGDVVLKEVVGTINQMIRSSDQLIRWGGDEFVGIFPGLRKEHIEEFGQKVLTSCSSIEIPVESGRIKNSVSVGFSYFNETDTAYSDVIKRADEALYKSKAEGKDKANCIF